MLGSSREPAHRVECIISGGQTGADRAALDAALSLGLEVAGWVPAGRWAEDGPIPMRYPSLYETVSADPAERTRLNVRDSDATLICSHGALVGGSLLTLKYACTLSRPVLHLDFSQLSKAEAVQQGRAWLHNVQPKRLNVAGPRASEAPRIYDAVFGLLSRLLVSDAA
ncbi:MAG: putative molybdenum carrier protein [Bacteroidota bacterium]